MAKAQQKVVIKEPAVIAFWGKILVFSYINLPNVLHIGINYPA